MMLVSSSLAVLLLGAPAVDVDERAVLRSDRPGSLARPEPLLEETLPALCRAEGAAAVYTARIAADGFGFDGFGDDGLAIDLARPLLALDGAALLHAEDKEGAFALTKTEAAGIVEKHAAGALSLDVVFRIAEDDEGALPACFTLAGSGQWALHVEPLAFELIDQNQATVARLRTPALARLDAWLTPGAPKLDVTVHPLDGAVDGDRAMVALGAVRPALDACLAPVAEGVRDPVALAYVADVSAAGKVVSVRPELVTADLEEVVDCVANVLGGAELLRAPKPYRMSVMVAVDRPGFAALYN